MTLSCKLLRGVRSTMKYALITNKENLSVLQCATNARLKLKIRWESLRRVALISHKTVPPTLNRWKTIRFTEWMNIQSNSSILVVAYSTRWKKSTKTTSPWFKIGTSTLKERIRSCLVNYKNSWVSCVKMYKKKFRKALNSTKKGLRNR